MIMIMIAPKLEAKKKDSLPEDISYNGIYKFSFYQSSTYVIITGFLLPMV